ncbi:hypothetical protein BOTBODRAFT_292383 [Botryobasidium botryosum FD-172 SS1]|uniref:Uncharacterized protein n=1 Tax=Botryobasidium botryosum (strain FD-172 SS1) TaxID=930990 RepID=A0A067MIU5_BOTB1|nr:hypothetical protein BOTBODRAFT_292383 [Botryobasidium botryosum FD-172 SS1]
MNGNTNTGIDGGHETWRKRWALAGCGAHDACPSLRHLDCFTYIWYYLPQAQGKPRSPKRALLRCPHHPLPSYSCVPRSRPQWSCACSTSGVHMKAKRKSRLRFCTSTKLISRAVLIVLTTDKDIYPTISPPARKRLHVRSSLFGPWAPRYTAHEW